MPAAAATFLVAFLLHTCCGRNLCRCIPATALPNSWLVPAAALVVFVAPTSCCVPLASLLCPLSFFLRSSCSPLEFLLGAPYASCSYFRCIPATALLHPCCGPSHIRCVPVAALLNSCADFQCFFFVSIEASYSGLHRLCFTISWQLPIKGREGSPPEWLCSCQ